MSRQQLGAFVAMGVFGALFLRPALAEQASPSEHARLLLRAGQVGKAERLVRSALDANAGDAALTCALGDILFRQADFQSAANAYKSALALDPRLARAVWGLGRIEQAEFRRKSARDYFAKAFRLDPRDPEIALAFADFVSSPQTRLGDSRSGRLVSGYRNYELKLTGFHPANSASNGLLVTTKINDGKPLRLVLDTGARGIVIDGDAARDLGLDFISESRIGGLGGATFGNARIALARTVSFGASVGRLELKDCVIEVSEKRLTNGANGVIGTNVFERFKIQLDARARALELIPFSGETDDAAGLPQPWLDRDRPSSAQSEPSTPAYGFKHLLLLRAKINGRKERLFLLDSGSAFTSLSADTGPQNDPGWAAIPLFGVRGALANAFRTGPIEIDISGRRMVDLNPVVMDLKQMSQREGVEISGIIGYSLLNQGVVTIDYRDGIVQLGTTH